MKQKPFILALFLFIACLQASSSTQVIAHRGYWDTEGSAQNSIRSLIKADSIGCYGCEFDVWLTSDNVLVVNHNKDIDGFIIEDETSDVLLKCKLKNGEGLPTLDAYLDAAKNLKVNLVLELKPHSDKDQENTAVDKIIEMVNRKGLDSRTCFITFSKNAYLRFIEKSRLATYFLSATSPTELKKLGGDGPDYNISQYKSHPDWLDEFKAMGKTTNVWTVNKPADIEWCLEHGIDFITTNKPELAQKMIQDYNQPQNLKVMSYNLRFGQLASAIDIANEIKHENPDFVALQEVDVNTSRKDAPIQNGINMVNQIAETTGMFIHYGRTLNFAGGYYGIAILSKHPCIDFKQYELPNPKNEEPRALIIGTFKIGGKHKINFACTHFDYKSEETREIQAKYVLDKLAECKYPVIIGGDFNATPEEPAIECMKSQMANISDTATTFPSHQPSRKLDYLFAQPKQCFEVVSKVTKPSLELNNSDHLAIITTVNLFIDKYQDSPTLVK